MPYIEGETLREKLHRETQLSIDEAVKITTEVADALDYAHRHGVIHRDIKPENILLHDGRPMVADFGIALAVSAAAGGRMTETGLSLGTPHYMSPEQATAEKDLTARSDVYSLGAVLFEMLTGEPPHTGASAQAIVMKIVTDEARPVTDLRKSVPPNVAAATAKALEKLPADRFPSAAALKVALADASFVAPTARPPARRMRRPGALMALAWLVSLSLTVAITWMLTAGARDGSDQRVRRLSIDIADAPLAYIGEASLGIGRRNLTISKDGSTIAYIGVEGGEGHVFVRPIDEFRASKLSGTERAYAPFFAPNGRELGFFVGNELRKVGIDGGDPIVLAGVANPTAGLWTDDGRILFAGLEGRELYQVPAGGGDAEVVFQGSDSVSSAISFDLLPGGAAALVSFF
jgi:serine/threonine-protein kinase